MGSRSCEGWMYTGTRIRSSVRHGQAHPVHKPEVSPQQTTHMAMAMAAADVCRVAVSGCAGRYSHASHVPREGTTCMMRTPVQERWTARASTTAGPILPGATACQPTPPNQRRLVPTVDGVAVTGCAGRTAKPWTFVLCTMCVYVGGTSVPRRRDARASTPSKAQLRSAAGPRIKAVVAADRVSYMALERCASQTAEGCTKPCVYVMCIMYVCRHAAYGPEHAARPSTAQQQPYGGGVHSRPTHEAVAAAGRVSGARDRCAGRTSDVCVTCPVVDCSGCVACTYAGTSSPPQQRRARPSTRWQGEEQVNSSSRSRRWLLPTVCRIAVRVCWPDSAESDG